MFSYRLIAMPGLPVMVAMTLAGRMRGRLPKGALAERLGLAPAATAGHGPAIWLHGASNGEIASARWLVDGLRAAVPGLRVLITSNTATARAMVADWVLPGVTGALAPFDAGGAAGRVLARWRPAALIVIENELWPGRVEAAGRAGVPVMVVGARMSERSAARWGRLAPGIMRRMLGGIAFLSAQDQGSEARLRTLGLPATAIGPRLALKGQGAADDAVPLPFAAPVPRDECLLAASTHEGEDAPLLDAFAASRAAGRFRHLILAPRHPRRAAGIAALVRARGFSMAQRSAGEVPGPQTAVHLADTMGEMDHWYRMAGVTVIGGTFVPVGGHTPWEPVRHGSAVVHGPSVFNNADAFAALDGAGGALAVADGAGLAAALIGLDRARQAQLAAAASAALVPAGDAAGLLRAICEKAGLQTRG
ncbi:MAG: glycosyltransferase N-terminal domain-containing protein [Paracoccaceae bacterium]